MSKDIKVYAITLIIATLVGFLGYSYTDSDRAQKGEYFDAKILSVENIEVEEFQFDGSDQAVKNTRAYFTAEIRSGELKTKVIEGVQFIDGMYPVDEKIVEVGDRIVIERYRSESGEPIDGQEWNFAEYNRSRNMMILGAVFFLLILAIGRKKGIATIVSLAYTAFAIFGVYIPAILSGINIYAITVAVSIYIIVISLTLLNGLNKKTICAILGNVGGTAVAGVLALLVNKIFNITGVVSQDHVFLTYLESGASIDLRAIIWGSVVIGALGAIMDVAMSISSSMNELAYSMKDRSFRNMLKAGMNIGKDIIGTMTNTLILAYIGGSLATVLIIVAYNDSNLLLFNMEMIVVEVVQAIIGSIGILFTVPSTALIASYMFNKSNLSEEEK